MKQRTFHEQNLVRVLENAASASHTPTWSATLLDKNERLIYMLVGHASVDVTFNVQTADDASGTNNTDVLSADITVDAVGLVTIEISSAILNRRGQLYVAPQVTRTAGTYTLLEVREALRNEGNLTYDASWLSRNAQLT